MPGYFFDLSGRVVLVTGASSGIGAHLARVFARAGAKVVLAARRADLLNTLRFEIAAAGGMAIAVSMDVADEISTIAAYDAAEVAFGTVDTVVANAGLAIGRSALSLPIEDFDRMVSVNLRGVFLTAREGARRMIAAGSLERGNGRIVLMSSITAQHVSAGKVAYSATKAGVVQMGRTLAFDWANKGINVNVVCPGYMRTDLNSEYLDMAAGQAMLSDFVRRREMPVDALDPTMLYLCSDASVSVTGSVFTIDDGQSL